MILRQILLILALGSLQFSSMATCFTSKEKLRNKPTVHMSNNHISQDVGGSTGKPFANLSELPGDPSLILTTNMDLGDKKLEVMKKISKAISETTGKPESYVSVSVTDKASVIFGYVYQKFPLLLMNNFSTFYFDLVQ